LTKFYGRRVGIDGLNLSVPAGTLFGFLGPNGSGKSTTIRVLLGLLAATKGRATIFGRDCRREGHIIKADVGYLPGDLRLYPWLTGRRALRFVGNVRGCDLMQPGMKLADDFGLDLDLRVRSMSRGTRQKLGLMIVLAHRPRLLILDEPTASLDPLMQAKLYRHLRGLAAEGHTVFFSSHTLSEVEDLCERVAILRQGRLAADEPLTAMRARARRVVVLRWRPDAVIDGVVLPPNLQVDERRGREWHATMSGAATDVVAWAAGRPLEDLTIGPPDLSAVFQRYYQESACED
jgi:ABC-2 type transport system ATP-binding protein